MMSQQGLAQVMDRYSNDAAFREKMRADPQGAIRSSGIQLDEQEMKTIQSMDWNLPDEHLKERVSKILGFGG
jgi:hypothetical protein